MTTPNWKSRFRDNAKIVRIPFGPKRYLRKESLWPYIEMFIDQTLAHFKRSGLPDIIHGHYADAGLAGAQLARLLHIPFVFTGHSLGRVKRQRLSLGKDRHGGAGEEVQVHDHASRPKKSPWKRPPWS